MHFSEPTKFGLVSAVANLASQIKDVDEQVRLEELGGKLLVIDVEELVKNREER